MAAADFLRQRFPLADFETWLAEWLDERPIHPRLLEPMRSAVLDGGKRFRAALVFAGTRIAGVSEERAYPLAGAVEMIHAYSLVHDDLPALDDAALRRGRPTLHRRYGEAMAILAGDALLTDAFDLVGTADALPERVLAASRSLSRAAGGPGMVGGQAGDILDLPTAEDVEVVRRIHSGKTGALIRWSLTEPMLLWSDDRARTEAVRAFSAHLGVLFQMRDDLLDIDPAATADKDRDADGAKSTYARLLGVEGARASAEEELQTCLEILDALPAVDAGLLGALARWTVGRTT